MFAGLVRRPSPASRPLDAACPLQAALCAFRVVPMTLHQRAAVNVPVGFALAALLVFAPVAARADSHLKQKLPEAPKQHPSVNAHGKSLDFLFDALKAAPDEESARAV